MASKIRENIPNKFVSIEHLKIVQNGKELEADQGMESWAGALENYSFIEKNDTTLFAVDADSKEQYKAYFFETWPKALNRLKAICEQ
jgi:ethanolamine utilization microcompartment shell protein EutS